MKKYILIILTCLLIPSTVFASTDTYTRTYDDLRVNKSGISVSNSNIGTFNAIVLDRGGNIGIGRRFMADLLFHTEAEASGFGLSRNVTFEVLRYGY